MGVKANPRVHLAHHLARSKVAREENQALFEVDRRIVPKPQEGFVQEPQQESGQRWCSLLDLIEQHQGQLTMITDDRL